MVSPMIMVFEIDFFLVVGVSSSGAWLLWGVGSPGA